MPLPMVFVHQFTTIDLHTQLTLCYTINSTANKKHIKTSQNACMISNYCTHSIIKWVLAASQC